MAHKEKHAVSELPSITVLQHCTANHRTLDFSPRFRRIIHLSDRLADRFTKSDDSTSYSTIVLLPKRGHYSGFQGQLV